ncbi:MAG: sigma-70 family RNA polymerase sigma factor [Planctomycetaceae bacterium]|nr:sigma-70 family RNA polymerase sigma factor [Planctomycetaceae bacterium]
MIDSDSQVNDLIKQVEQGHPHALGELLQRYRGRLLRIVDFRMDSRLRSRLDATDVIQETFIEVTIRFEEYLTQPEMPFFLWLRFIALQKLLQLRRHHIGVQSRNAEREVPLFLGAYPQATSAVLAAHLLGKQTTPSEAAIRAESRVRLEQALNSMDNIDREVLALRHFERMTNKEVSTLLDLTETAASNRYMRALKRLRRVMESSQSVTED